MRYNFFSDSYEINTGNSDALPSINPYLRSTLLFRSWVIVSGHDDQLIYYRSIFLNFTAVFNNESTSAVVIDEQSDMRKIFERNRYNN